MEAGDYSTLQLQLQAFSSLNLSWSKGITVLETQVVVLKIGMISVEKACFEAEMRVVTTWQEPKLEIEKVISFLKYINDTIII